MSNKNKKDLTGFRVAHDFDDFVEDREVILTLKDSNILDGEKFAEREDILENIDLAEAYKSQVDLETKTKVQYINSLSNFQKGAPNEYKYGEEKTLLSKYDEKKRYKDGFVLDMEGEYNLDKLNQLDSIRAKLSGKGDDNSGLVSLETTKNIASEYYTGDEMKKFSKPMRKPTANMKKKKEDIIAFLEDSLQEDTNEDHANRETLSKQREKAEYDDMVTKKKKTENYEAALDKARDLTRHSNFYDDEYDEIERAIENQRRKTLQLKEASASKPEDFVKNLLETGKEIEKKEKEASKNIEILLEKRDIKDGKVEGKFLLTYDWSYRIEDGSKFNRLPELSNSTRGDHRKRVKDVDIFLFINRAKGFLRPQPKNLSLKDSRQGITSVVNVSLPSEKLMAWSKSNTGVKSVLTNKNEGEEKKTEAEPLTKEDLEEMKEEVKFLEEDNLNTGLAAALKAIRDKGYVNADAELNTTGRAKDKTYEEELSKFKTIGKDIKLEYRDEKGRLMTPKEAFRYQCWLFHGKRPGRSKQEKRWKKEQTARKALSTAPDQTATMRTLERIQQETSQPYAIMSSSKTKK